MESIVAALNVQNWSRCFWGIHGDTCVHNIELYIFGLFLFIVFHKWILSPRLY